MKKIHTVVIGGTRGLGAEVVKLFSQEGHQLSVLARTSLENTDNVTYVEADLLKEHSFLSAIEQVISTQGDINHLIFLQRYRGTGDHWSGNLEVGLNATRKIIAYLKDKFCKDENTDKSIVMVSSVAGTLANDSQPISYSITKAGLNYMVKYYAVELGQYGIRVNGVSPIGFIKEESKKYYLEENKSLNKLYQDIIPLKRMGNSQDVANVISFLCSSGASFISGQNIAVDGGLSVRSHETLALELSRNTKQEREKT